MVLGDIRAIIIKPSVEKKEGGGGRQDNMAMARVLGSVSKMPGMDGEMVPYAGEGGGREEEVVMAETLGEALQPIRTGLLSLYGRWV